MITQCFVQFQVIEIIAAKIVFILVVNENYVHSSYLINGTCYLFGKYYVIEKDNQIDIYIITGICYEKIATVDGCFQYKRNRYKSAKIN
jgi:hypothetical protein